jgi:TonB family protein
VHVLAQVVCGLYWFHPLFWMAARGLYRESEQAADDEVLGLGLDASTYADHLLAIVRASRASVSSRAPLVAMARRPHLERRVTALLNACANRDAITCRASCTASVMAMAVVLPLAAMTNRDVGIDVNIRTLNLPSVVSASAVSGSDPVLAAVRLMRVAPEGVDGTLVPPSIVEYTTPPLYSEEGRRRGVEGTVTVAVQVDEGGRVAHASVVRGLGFGLDQNALVALRQWRFRPGMRERRPVAMGVEIDVEFSLRNEGVNELIANDMATLVGPGVTPPRAVRTAGSVSPRPRVRGTVVLDVVLQEDGTPKIVRILRSLTPETDEIAVRQFEQWRFSPAMKGGQPVKVRMNAEVRFHG